MKTSNWVGLSLAFLATVGFLGLRRAEPQTGNPSSELIEAQSYKNDSFYEEATPRLNAISQKYPGSEEDLSSRFESAHIKYAADHDLAGAKSIFQSIVRDFPNRSEATIAKINLADIHYLNEHGTLETYLAELDGLALSLGGPSVTAISNDQGNLKIGNVPGWSSEEQSASLFEIYTMAAARLARRNPKSTSEDGLRGLRLLSFSGDHFPTSDSAFLEEFEDSQRIRDGGQSSNPISRDHAPPSISRIRARPKKDADFILMRLDDDYSGVNLTTLKVTVDGQLISGNANGQVVGAPQYRYRIREFRKKERMVVSVIAKVPLPDLTQGSHLILVSLSDLSGKSATERKRIRVRRQHDMDVEDQSQEEEDDF